MSEAPAAFVL